MSSVYSFDPVQDWETILRRGFETKEFDYKAPCSWDVSNKKACCEIVKDILAMANTKGGFIVVGVDENDTGFLWKGLAKEQCKSFETTRLNQFVQKYTDPAINTKIIKHESQGSNFVIIEVPRFPDTPHICQKDFPEVLRAGEVYVRTDNNESAPIKNSTDMRSIVEHAVRNRGDQLLSSFRAILTGTPQFAPSQSDIEQFDVQVQEAAERCRQVIPKGADNLGFRETVFRPLEFKRLRFTHPELESMAEAGCVAYRGWPYIFYSDRRLDCITHLDDSLEMLLSDSEVFQFWRLHQSGLLYINEMFPEDSRQESRPQLLLGIVPFAYTCAEAIQCLVDLYTGRIDDDESVRLFMRLNGVRGRKLARVRGSTYCDTPYECETEPIVYDNEHTLADWRASVIPHAIELLRYVNHKFNAPDTSEAEVAPLMQKLLTRQL